MSKIKKITVSNLKAITLQTATFNGCTAIITGRNNAGKTSFLRGLFDRVRGIKADDVIRKGETEGFAEAELTTGERIKWEFNDKGKGFKEKLTYTTEKDIKTPLTTELRNRFAPDTFDVDRFLSDPPMKQRKTLQDLAGLDFTDIDTRYATAYSERTAANTRANDAKTIFGNAIIPDTVKPIELQPLLDRKETIRKELNDLYLRNKAHNDNLRQQREAAIEADRKTVNLYNNDRALKETDHNDAFNAAAELKRLGFDTDDLKAFVKELFAKIGEPRIPTVIPEPTYIPELPDNAPILTIDTEIEQAHETNRKAQVYKDWVQLRTNKDTTATLANEADTKVKAIEKERTDLIKTANMPEGFTFTDDGIAYNGLSFTREQLSSSGIYIAALKLASMKIGEIRTLHFDASFLDKISLAEIEVWANHNDLQLLIERPDFEGGEITYELVSNE